ncbi:MAG: prolyl oligopeptidase family serine peptidase, partial [Clostridia bacterium]|nr:prolyl oligopeptidase family serine peptidase [Clostridia bacterium]
DGADWRRRDFSKLIVTQKNDVLDASGAVLSEAGILPTMLYDELTNFELDEFISEYFQLSNGNQMYYSYWLPEDYDPSMKYPMVVSITGGGGSNRTQANGDATGGHISRDRGAVAWLTCGQDVIVLSPQQANDPYATTPDDVMEIVNYFLDNFSVDPDRVTCMGSSAGGLTWSTILANPEYAGVFAAYAPCNTHFNGAQTMFKAEYDVARMEQTFGFSSFEDYMDPELVMDDSEYYDAAKEAFEQVVNNRINVWVWHGYNDETAPTGRGVSSYMILRRIYEEEGLSDEEIDELVKLTLVDTQEFHDLGILSYHMASKVAVSHQEFLDWMLSQTRAD